MAGDPQECRQRALMCANRAAKRTSPAARQRSADLALVWLMLAVQLEGQRRSRPAEKVKSNRGAPVRRKELHQ